MKKGLSIKIPRFLLFCWIAVIFHPLTLAAVPQQNLNVKIDLQLDQKTIAESLKAIEQKTGLAFCFYEEIINKQTAKVTLNIKQASVSEALTEILRNTDLTYKETPNCIVIEKKSKPEGTSNPASGFGSIKGRVVEAETSEPLPGANVVLVGTKMGVSTDADGYYHFEKIPSGRYTLEVSYIGFQKTTIDVQVAASKTATYDVKMSGDANVLDEVTITTVRRQRSSVPHMTEKLMVQEIKALQVVASGISSEQISRSADRNAADAVAKVSGVSIRDDKFIVIRGMNERYNLTYLNDNVAPSTELYSRAFALDLLPTRIIDRIMVYKSPSPDMMADMTGGAVKIYTKDATLVKHFDIEVQTGYRPHTTFNNNFMTYDGGKWDWLGFDDGTRKLPSAVPGYGDFTKAKISQKEYAENFSPTLQYQKMKGLPLGQITINYYNAFLIGNRYLSILSSLSYKNESRQNTVSRMQSAFDGNSRTHNLIDEVQSQQTAQLTWLQNFSYKLSDNSSIKLKNFFLQQGQSVVVDRTQYNKRFYGIYTDADYAERFGQPANVPGWYSFTSSPTDERNIVLGYTQRFLYAGNLSGEHRLTGKKKQQLDWNLGYMFSRQDIPDQRVFRFTRGDATTYRMLNPTIFNDYQWIAKIRPVNTELDYNRSVDKGILSRTWSRNTEKSYNASIDYSYDFMPWAQFKAGTFHQWKERVQFRRVYTVNEGDLNDLGYPNNGLLAADGRYMDYNLVFFKEQDLGNVWSDEYLRDDGSALKVFDRTSGADAYTATEQNNSGYTALSLKPFGEKLDIYGGVRVEYNRQKVAGAIPQGNQKSPTEGGLNRPILVDINRLDWLPSINASYRPTAKWVFRGAYGKTVNRPEFRELSPYSELEYLNNQVIYGNENLVPASIDNMDLRLEWYPNAANSANAISVGVFYKDLDKPIERILYKDLNYSTPTYISFANAESGVVKGIELDIRQQLDFIPVNFLRNFSVVTNVSFINSKVKKESETHPGSPELYERQMQGQAPYIINAGLFYENAGTGTKLSLLYNHIGPRIYAAAEGDVYTSNGGGGYAGGGSAGSIIELSRGQLDFSLVQRMAKSLQLKFAVQNVLNSPIETAEDENFTYKYEKAKLEKLVDGGSSSPNQFSGDPISSSYKPYPYFTLSITYSF